MTALTDEDVEDLRAAADNRAWDHPTLHQNRFSIGSRFAREALTRLLAAYDAQRAEIATLRALLREAPGRHVGDGR